MINLSMLTITRTFLLCLLLSFSGSQALAQSFMPSQQQIQQFKNLPRAQQEQLANDVSDSQFSRHTIIVELATGSLL